MAAEVRDGYNAVAKQQRRSTRGATRGVHALRHYNNRVKKVLINAYLAPMVEGMGNNTVQVLDVACGKGGDAGKVLRHAVLSYTGIDISEASVAEARRRHPAATFKVGAFEAMEERPAHFVMCNFALHYLFRSEEAGRKAVVAIARNLLPGGTWIGIVPDEGRMKQVLRGEAALPPFCTVEAADPGYSFWLQGCVPGLVEYFVPFRALEQAAVDSGLVCHFKANLYDFATGEGGLPAAPDDVAAVTSLYSAFAFYRPLDCQMGTLHPRG